MKYRPARSSDARQIALLHADSWRRTYRGLFSDDFLNYEADADRTRVWNERLGCSRADQFVCVAEDSGIVKGFICVYGNEDPEWGSLIDNLHVTFTSKRQGLGTMLMTEAFKWLESIFATEPIYLWVMENNAPARQFYEKLGASNAGAIDKANPVGGGSAMNCRYTWPSPAGEQ
jgi:GNAT superfamily N-acetyltransferase